MMAYSFLNSKEVNSIEAEITGDAFAGNAISGNARKVLATLKSTATIDEILETLESNYGNIKSGERIMEDFYTAKQEKDEELSAWGVRLESILQLYNLKKLYK